MKYLAFALLCIAVILLGVSNCITQKQTKEIKDNLMDIDQRLTVLEQSLNETDQAVVKALQGSNEALYELKLQELYGK